MSHVAGGTRVVSIAPGEIPAADAGGSSPEYHRVDRQALQLLPAVMIRHHRVLPLSRSGDLVTLAMVNPNDHVALASIRRQLRGMNLRPVPMTVEQFNHFMSTTYTKLVGSARNKESVFSRMMRKNDEEPVVLFVANTPSATIQPVLINNVPTLPAVPAVDFLADTVSYGDVAPESESLTGSVTMSLQDLVTDLECEYVSQGVPQLQTNEYQLEYSANETPVVKLASYILAHAVKRGASDIHLEPQENEVLLRFRIDGVMHEEQVIPKRVQLPLISRFKIIANLDIAERRLPQDGRIAMRLEGRQVDIRMSTMPTRYGEKLCMRVLDKAGLPLELSSLIKHEPTLQKLCDVIAQPHGIIFVTGPTGSGKTTTLYSALSALNTPDVNISTVEDPIEYDLPRVNQVQVNKEIGLDFARVLRGFLRQDPDIMLVGETRDRETARTAIEAALTGHVVLTSLHTNSAADTFARLTDLGVEPFLSASATVGVVAQRLVRRVCEACKESYIPDEETLNYLNWPYDEAAVFCRGAGCEKCNGSGYKGRIGIYEVLTMTPELRRMVNNREDAQDIHAKAVDNGMVDLKSYAHYLLAEGETTVEEVLSAVAFAS